MSPLQTLCLFVALVGLLAGAPRNRRPRSPSPELELAKLRRIQLQAEYARKLDDIKIQRTVLRYNWRTGRRMMQLRMGGSYTGYLTLD